MPLGVNWIFISFILKNLIKIVTAIYVKNSYNWNYQIDFYVQLLD